MMNTQMGSILGLVLAFAVASEALAEDKSVPLHPGALNGKQIEKLFYGRTVSAKSVDDNKQIKVFYFHKNGKVTRAQKGRLTKGKWKIREDGRLCINLKGKRSYCRIIVKQKKQVQQYVAKSDGNHRHELNYAVFKKGKHLKKISKFPILPKGTLNQKQVVEIFSGKSVLSETVKNKRTSMTYYHPDGRVEQVRHGMKRVGTWRVTKNGRMCIQMEDLAAKCRIIVKEGEVFNKYIVKKNGKHQHSVRYHEFLPAKKF